MNNTLTSLGIALASAILIPTGQAADLKDGREIMASYETSSKLLNVKSDAILTNTEPGGAAPKVKKFTWWRKLGKDGVHFRTLTHFHEPSEIRGEQVLFTEQEGDKADVLLYLPAYKKTRRVEKQSHSRSFMGSEFSYADIATPHLDDFNYKKLADETCTGPCYVIETQPKTEAVKERTGYTKVIYRIRKDNFMIASAEYFDSKGVLAKKFTAAQITEVDPTNHRWMALKIEMVNVVSQRKTVIEFSNVNTKDPVPDAKFSPQNLGR